MTDDAYESLRDLRQKYQHHGNASLASAGNVLAQIRYLRSKLPDDPNLAAKGEAWLAQSGAPLPDRRNLDLKKIFKKVEYAGPSGLESWISRTQESIVEHYAEERAKRSNENEENKLAQARGRTFNSLRNRRLAAKSKVERQKLCDQQGGMPSDRVTTDRRNRCAKVVNQANRKQNLGLSHAFQEAIRSDSQPFDDAWALLKTLFGEVNDPASNGCVTDPRECKSGPEAAMRFLENQFDGVMHQAIERNGRRAGAVVPTAICRVRAYARLQLLDELEFDRNGNPVWAECYFLIRSGKLVDAVQFLENQEDPNFLVETTGNRALAEGLLHWARKQPVEAEERDLVIAEYHQLARHIDRRRMEAKEMAGSVTNPTLTHQGPADPYKLILLEIVGGIYGQASPDLTTEDLIWHSMVTNSGHDEILKRVRRHGKVATGYLVGVQLQYWLLLGYYDDALEYLNKFPNYSLELSHYALVLMFHGKLKRFDVVSKIMEFISPIAKDQPTVAADYLEMVCRSERDESKKYLPLVNFLATYGPIEDLVGRLKPNFTHVLGYLDNQFSREILDDVLGKAAVETLDRMRHLAWGNYEDTVRQAAIMFVQALVMYNLASDYDAAQGLLEEALDDWLSSRVHDSRIPRQFLKVMVPRKPRKRFEFVTQPVPPRVLPESLRSQKDIFKDDESTPIVSDLVDARLVRPVDQIQTGLADSLVQGGDAEHEMNILVDLAYLARCSVLFYQTYDLAVRTSLFGYLQVMEALDHLQLEEYADAEKLILDPKRFPCPLWDGTTRKWMLATRVARPEVGIPAVFR